MNTMPRIPRVEGGPKRITGIEKERKQNRRPTRFELIAAGTLALSGAHEAHAQETATNMDVPGIPGIEEAYEAGEAELQKYGCDGEFAMVDPNTGRVNWVRLLEPGYGVVERDQDAGQHVEFAVPYEWARAFDAGVPVDPAYQEQVRAYIQEQIQEQLFDNLHGFGWDKKDFAVREGLQENQILTVRSITIEGLTSPEAQTVDSVAQGAVDPENLNLGELRADDALLRVKEALANMGIDVDAAALEQLSSDELQFTDEEMDTLESLGRQIGKTGTYEDVTFQLIEDYNTNKIEDPEILDQIDQIVASKRMVNIDIQFNEVEKDRWLVPALWPLLLPLLLRRFRRRPREIPQGPFPEPIGPANEPLVDVVPTQLENPERYVHDVAIDVIKNFYFYQPIVDRYIEQENPNLNDMIHSVLEAWTTNDNELRRAAGQEPINHRADPRQVFYANLHARALRRMILDAQAQGAHTPVSEIWNRDDTRRRIAQEIMEEVQRGGRREI